MPLSTQVKLLRVLEIGRDRPRRHERPDQGQRPADLGHEPRPGRGHRRGDVPPGPVPPAQGRQRQAPAAPRAPRGHPAADRLLPQGVHRRARQGGHARSRPAVRKVLMAYAWPGNVRELKNVDREHGRDRLRRHARRRRPDRGPPAGCRRRRRRRAAGGVDTLVGKSLEEIEQLYIAETLKLTSGNREEAARLLGIGERTLYRKIKEYGIG